MEGLVYTLVLRFKIKNQTKFNCGLIFLHILSEDDIDLPELGTNSFFPGSLSAHPSIFSRGLVLLN
jgi:hypothetical protein